MSRKRVAPANPDRDDETVIKVEDPAAAALPHADDQLVNDDDDKDDADDSDDEDEQSPDIESYTDQPRNVTSGNELSYNDTNSNDQARSPGWLPQNKAKAMDLVPRRSPREIFTQRSEPSIAHDQARQPRERNPHLRQWPVLWQEQGQRHHRPSRMRCDVRA